MSIFTKGGKKRQPATGAGEPQIDSCGNTLVSASIRRAVALVPGGGDIPNWPCDAILLSEDATVTVQLEEDVGTIALPLVGGVWHGLACRKVTGVTAGTVFAGWLRNPAP